MSDLEQYDGVGQVVIEMDTREDGYDAVRRDLPVLRDYNVE